MKANPKRLALWAFCGALLAASGFLTTLLPFPRRVWLGAFLVQALVGFAVWFSADSRLKRLYRAGAWSEEELAPTRALLAHPAWVWGTLGLLLGAVIWVALTNHRGGMMIYMAVMPMNAISSMRAALAPPKARGPGLVDWKSIKPLHSEHWGEARGEDDVLSHWTGY